MVYNIHKNLKGNFTMDIITKPVIEQVIRSEIIDSGGNLSGASTGAPCRSERTAKCNRLFIEDELKGGKAL